MSTTPKSAALVHGIFIALGLAALGYLLSVSVAKFREYDRTVVVKGLAEQEYPANVAIWPIEFTVAGNSLESLYATTERNTRMVEEYLTKRGINAAEITVKSPSITDKTAQQWSGSERPEYRYNAVQTLTVYTEKVDVVRAAQGGLSELGKQGIVFTSNGYQSQTEYLFTRLNDVKPEMIEEATRNAREVAEKFASDSKSNLGKIKSARQGTFSIVSRDKNNPHIKKVRVVSTVEYYLND